MSENGSQAECEKFPGRLRDLCEGRGRDGRPNPTRKAANAWRMSEGLPKLDRQPAINVAVISGQTPSPAAPRQHAPPAPTFGPGTELKKIFESLGIQSDGCGGCYLTLQAMDKGGAQECRERRDEFIAEIKSRRMSVTLATKIVAAGAAVLNGLAFSINWADPIPGLFDEAVKRAKK